MGILTISARRRWLTLMPSAAMLAATLLAVPTPAQAASTCITDTTGGAAKILCLAVPEDGATVGGNVTVVGTVDPVNGPRTQKVEFYLDNEYVLTDYRSSSNSSAIFDFELPTEYWVDGTHRLEMHAITREEAGTPSYITQRVGIDITFANGITSVPPNTNTFTPSPGRTPGSGEVFTVAATGDGASGEPNATAVTDMLVTENPNLMLYLGDVYEKGTRTEFHNWYGDETRLWGRLRSVTNPTIGNHEYENGVAPGYFDYWDNIPNFYSYDVAGWHMIALNSTNAFRDDPIQLNWLLADIAANDARCTLAYWHDPRWSIGTQGDEDAMQEEWAALVAAGVDVVLGGNDHNYQRWEPLGPDGQLDPDGAVQFVAGAGGHGVRPFAPGESAANPRVAAASDTLDTFGALFLELHEDRADFRYLNTSGVVLDQGSISCGEVAAQTPREQLRAIRDDLNAAVPSLSGTAEDKAREAIEELDKTLDDNTQWDDQGVPSSSEGQKAFDKVKKAVDKLRDVNDPPSAIASALESLVVQSQEMAQASIDTAIANNGSPAQILKAGEHMDQALVKLDDDEPHKAVDEYKKAWEEAAEAGAFDVAGFRADYLDVTNDLATASTELTGQAADRAADAVNELSEAYVDDDVWDATGMLSDGDGKIAFDQAKRAVEKLRGVNSPPSVINSSIDQLVDMAAILAWDKVGQAIAAGGSQSKIDDALDHIAKAVDKLDNGEPHKAIDEYKKAWEKARDAL